MTDEQPTTPTEDEHGHAIGSDVERMEKGYTPLGEAGNRAPREERERAALAELAAVPRAVRAFETDDEAAARITRERALPAAPEQQLSGAMVNGVQYLWPAGSEPPAEVRQTLEDAAQPLRTGQMQGLAPGVVRGSGASPSVPSPTARASRKEGG